MNLFGAALLSVLGFLACSASLAAELAGYWQNEGQPAWIEIRVDNETAIGTVRRNDNKPDAVGRILLRDVVSDENNPGSWRGQIYAERLGEYRDAEITLAQPDQMQIKVNVGFMSRTVSWTRAAQIPTE
jgi:uncharacterized protein (DUF2147 family)